jgi:hypothetical protein
MKRARLTHLRASLALAVLCASLRPVHADESPTAAPTLDSLIDAVSQIRPAENGVHVAGATMAIGHLELSIAEGVAVPLVGKGGMPVGMYFEGKGGWRYTADDPADLETMRTNIRRTAKTLRMLGPNVLDDFKRLLVLFTEPMFEDVWKAPADSTNVALPAGASKSVEELLTRSHDSNPEFTSRLVQARLNRRGKWLAVEMDGGVERAGYTYDDVRDGYERLVNFRNVAGYGRRFTQTLSIQTIPGWTPARRTWFVLSKADIDIATDDNRSGTINSDLAYTVLGTGTRALSLELVTALDPDRKDWDWQKQRLNVTRVLDAEGRALPFVHRYDELLIEIPPTATPESEVRLRVETEGEVFLDVTGRHSDNYFFLHGFDWLPTPTGWAGQQFVFHIKVRTKKPWRPVMSGKEISLVDDGTYLVAESVSDHPSILIGVFAGKYVTREEIVDGLTVRAHGYAMARKDVLEKLPKLTAAFAKFYASILGPMPAEELDVVEVPEYGFGIAPYGIILITTEAFNARREEDAQVYSHGINSRLAHEVAHQWFGHRVWPVEAADNWLAESFAEYFSGIAMGVMGTNNRTAVGFEQMLSGWRDESRDCDDAAPISTANYLGGDQSGFERRCLLYRRGPLVLHMLRTMIGNDRFMGAMRAFLDTARDGPATTDDFAKAVSAAVGTDMRWFFDQWVRASGIPTIDVATHVEGVSGGKYRLSGTMSQLPGARFKKVMVPLVFDMGGKTESRVVFADQPETKFSFLLDRKPGFVKVDPFHNNLAVYR